VEANEMVALYERYTEEMRSEFDYLSTWLPNAHVELGDVGVLRRDRFERLTSLGALGVDFAVRERDRGVDLDYASAGGVSVEVNGAGEGSPAAEQRICVSFGREHGVLFQAMACRITEVADRQALGRVVLALADEGRWDARHVVVTEVVNSGPTVVLMSDRCDARIDLMARLPDVVAVTAGFPLASLSAGLSVVSALGIGVRIIAPQGLTPLFRVSGVRRRLVGADRFETRGSGAAPPLPADDSLVFAELTYEDVEV
jgi:hypothetical protein